MSAHSPGPWKWVPFRNWDGGLQAADGSWVIANDESDSKPENPADARLVEGAPEMLDLLAEIATPAAVHEKCSPRCYHQRAQALVDRIREGKT